MSCWSSYTIRLIGEVLYQVSFEMWHWWPYACLTASDLTSWQTNGRPEPYILHLYVGNLADCFHRTGAKESRGQDWRVCGYAWARWETFVLHITQIYPLVVPSNNTWDQKVILISLAGPHSQYHCPSFGPRGAYSRQIHASLGQQYHGATLNDFGNIQHSFSISCRFSKAMVSHRSKFVSLYGTAWRWCGDQLPRLPNHRKTFRPSRNRSAFSQRRVCLSVRSPRPRLLARWYVTRSIINPANPLTNVFVALLPSGIYTAPTYDAMQYDLKLLKQLSFNMLRKHVKVEPDLYYYACDKLGLMVWQASGPARVSK